LLDADGADEPVGVQQIDAAARGVVAAGDAAVLGLAEERGAEDAVEVAPH
jgi:hypothetical protein